MPGGPGGPGKLLLRLKRNKNSDLLSGLFSAHDYWLRGIFATWMMRPWLMMMITQSWWSCDCYLANEGWCIYWHLSRTDDSKYVTSTKPIKHEKWNMKSNNQRRTDTSSIGDDSNYEMGFWPQPLAIESKKNFFFCHVVVPSLSCQPCGPISKFSIQFQNDSKILSPGGTSTVS